MHWALDGAGVLVAQPPPEADALPPEVFAAALAQAVAEARHEGVRGPRRTPFLLQRLAVLTQGQTLRVNQSLIEANASLAGRLAVAFSRES
jgi:pseudouridine-5'-phosphate glycosidase